MIIVKEVEDEEGVKVRQYKCEIDGKTLWRRYVHNNVEVLANDCDHYEWEAIGNGCYPIETDSEICRGTKETVKESVKKIDEGTTIWFLVPRRS